MCENRYYIIERKNNPYNIRERKNNSEDKPK